MKEASLGIGVAADREQLRLVNWLGAEAFLPFHGPCEVAGGAVAHLQLQDPVLPGGTLAERAQFLRQGRHLLRPGGTLTLPAGAWGCVGAASDLARAAWLCGFEAGLIHRDGAAVLTKPLRRAESRPLVSILIPAYKAEFLAESLGSALAQTWDRCEVVVCDDSGRDDVRAVVDAVLRRPGHAVDPAGVRYLRNPGNLGQQKNYLRCLAEARGQYIKFLNDDDVLAETCVEAMACCLRDNPAVTLVTSARELIDAEGRPLAAEACNEPLAPHDAVLEGRHLATRLLTEKINRIGEPSTAMFRREDMLDNQPHLFAYNGTVARRNGDTYVWASLLARGDAIFLREPLSRFRQHPGQTQRDPDFVADAHAVWFELEADARATGLVEESHLGPVRPCAPAAAQVGADDYGTAASGAALVSLLRANDHHGALAWLRARLQARPGHVRLRSDLGGVLWAAGRTELGLAETLLALGAQADESAAHNLGQMLRAAGRATQAEAVERWLGTALPSQG